MEAEKAVVFNAGPEEGERAAFESDLLAYFAEIQPNRVMTQEAIIGWRGPEGIYADRPVVRGMWEGWQRRAALASKVEPGAGAQSNTLPQAVLDALRFYAHGHHFNIDYDHQQFDTVSGEAQNLLFSEQDGDCSFVEDGSVARSVLCGDLTGFEEGAPDPIDGEVFNVTPPAPIASASEAAPVAWRAINLSGVGDEWAYRDADDRFEDQHGNPTGEPLYTLPAQPRALTDEQIKDAVDAIDFSTMVTADDFIYVVARAVLSAAQPDAETP